MCDRAQGIPSPLRSGAVQARSRIEAIGAMGARHVESGFMTSDTPVKLSAEERAERAERMAREGAKAMADHQAAIRALDERTVRLRALRLAKEAQEAKEAKVAKVAKPTKPAPKRARAAKA